MIIKSIIKKVLLYCGLDIRLAKKNQILSVEEIKKVNDNTLSYIKSLSVEELEKRVNSITYSGLLSTKSIPEINSILNKEGIVVVPGVLDNSKVDETKKIIKDIIQNIKKSESPEKKNRRNYIVQNKIIKGQSYYDLSNNPKSVVVIRQGNDQGMIDVFNVNRLLGKLGDEIYKVFLKDWLVDLLKNSNEPVNPKNLNLYINHSVTSTRGFHVDSNYRSIKGFIYLTDVNTIEDGPYCFVKGTHIDTPFSKVNKSLGEKEAPFINILDIIPVLGKKGTLILSDQSGIHRGIPQRIGSIREVLVMRYA
jgi:hypothetical protein